MFPSLRIFTNAASKRVIPNSREVKELMATEVPGLSPEGYLLEPKLSPLPFTDDQLVFLRSLLPLKIEDAAAKLHASEHREPILHSLLSPPIETDPLPREVLEYSLRPVPLDEWIGEIKSDIPLPPGISRGPANNFPGPIDWTAAWDFLAKIDPHGDRPEIALELAQIQNEYQEQCEAAHQVDIPEFAELPQLADFTKLLSLQWDRWRAFGSEVFEVIDELAKFRQALDQFMLDLPKLTVHNIEEAYPEWGDEILPVLEQRQWAFDESAVVFHDDEAAAIEDKARSEAVGKWMENWDESERQFFVDFFDGKDVKPPPISLWHLIEMTPDTPPPARVDIIQAQFTSNDPHDHAHH